MATLDNFQMMVCHSQRCLCWPPETRRGMGALLAPMDAPR